MSLTLNLAVLGYCIYGLLHGFNISWKGDEVVMCNVNQFMLSILRC
jgi:hypothetical protein